MKREKKCLVVGGSGGIGYYIVKAFAEAGYDVAFTYFHNKQSANKTEREFNAKAYYVDSCNEVAIKELSNTMRNEDESLDALVYASGICEDSLIMDMELDSWNHVINTNLTGVFLYAKHMMNMLRASGNGRFVAVGSVMGDTGVYGSCSYAVSKAGLVGLIKSIALENAKYGVTANVVSYGYIDAGMTAKLPEKVLESAMKKIPMKKLGNPDDAAKIIVDICQEHMGYISGQVIRNNGLLYV